MATDDYARKSAARAWQAALDAERRLEDILTRLERVEATPTRKKLQQCGYCGTWTLAPVCSQHVDCWTETDLLEEALGA